MYAVSGKFVTSRNERRKKQNTAYVMKRNSGWRAPMKTVKHGFIVSQRFRGVKTEKHIKTDHLVSFQVALLFRSQIRKIITASEMVHHCSGQLPLRLGSVLGRRNRQSTWCFSLHPHGAAKKVKKVLDFRTDFLGHSTIDAHCLNQLFEVYI